MPTADEADAAEESVDVSPAAGGPAAAVGAADARRILPVPQLLGLMMPAMSYGLVCASVGVLVLPQEAQFMFGELRSVYLAAMLALTGVSQLVSPLAGYASDRTTSRLGRRLPYILGGNAVLLVALIALYLSRTWLWGYAYLVSLFVATLALNVMYTGFTGLVSDLIHPSQLGFSSGVMGGLVAIGAVTGLLGVGFFLPLQFAYPLYGGTAVVAAILNWLAVHDLDVQLTREARPACSGAELLHAYWISPSTHGDFFWVFVSRTFYYMAVSVQIYILYFLRDMVGWTATNTADPILRYYIMGLNWLTPNGPTHNDAWQQGDESQEWEEGDEGLEWVSTHAVQCTTLLCVVSQGAAGLVAANAGSLSDRVGRKPLIYMSCTVMGSMYIGYIFAQSFTQVLILGIVYVSFPRLTLACCPEYIPSADKLAPCAGREQRRVPGGGLRAGGGVPAQPRRQGQGPGPRLPGLAAALGAAEAWLDLRRRCGGSRRFSAPASGPHSQARC